VKNGVLAKAKLVMTDKQYKVFELWYGQDKNALIIAELLKVSVASVYKTLERARAKMVENWR